MSSIALVAEADDCRHDVERQRRFLRLAAGQAARRLGGAVG
jgi:hypothetical protein